MKEKTFSLHKPSRLGEALLLLLLGVVLLGFPLLSATAQDFVKPDKEQLKQTLTPLQYAVTQKDKTEPPYRAKRFSPRSINMTAVQAGPALPGLWKRVPLSSAMIGNYLRSALRCARNWLTAIWAMFLTTVRPRPVCDIALILPLCVLCRWPR